MPKCEIWIEVNEGDTTGRMIASANFDPLPGPGARIQVMNDLLEQEHDLRVLRHVHCVTKYSDGGLAVLELWCERWQRMVDALTPGRGVAR